MEFLGRLASWAKGWLFCYLFIWLAGWFVFVCLSILFAGLIFVWFCLFLCLFDWLVDLFIYCMWFRDRNFHGPDGTRPWLTGPLHPILVYGCPVTLLKFQMAPRLVLLMPSGSKKKEPRYTYLSEAKTWHSQRVWAEVSSSAPHLLHSETSDSPIRWRCLLRVLCPVRRPITAMDCVLLTL